MRKLVAEFTGTAFITAAVIGSAIMATNWTKDGAIWLLVNMISTVSALYISIVLFASISGAHFNPVVSLVKLIQRELSGKDFLSYLIAQFLGAIFGASIAHFLFDYSIFSVSEIERDGLNIFAAEVVASFGLVLIVIANWRKFKVRNRASLIALWIASAYFFTSSTSFANPAVSLGRMLTDSLAGISPSSLALFIPAQVLGGLLALFFANFLAKGRNE
ncbi:MAG: aquaporin family protein [Candidatus Nanopelagicaceae bacterium]|nr:aquaporin family protein [Candidatus Nanopelagicaceae bacterium]